MLSSKVTGIDEFSCFPKLIKWPKWRYSLAYDSIISIGFWNIKNTICIYIYGSKVSTITLDEILCVLMAVLVEHIIICDVLRDLVPFVQFKKREKHPWRGTTFSKVCNLSKTLSSVFFTIFKLCKWCQIAQRITYGLISFSTFWKTLHPLFFNNGRDNKIKRS